MNDDHLSHCDRCGHAVGAGGRAALNHGRGTARRARCVECLSWAEKDLFLSLGPRRRMAAEREGRFTRPAGVPV